jgi:hypothetical protein
VHVTTALNRHFLLGCARNRLSTVEPGLVAQQRTRPPLRFTTRVTVDGCRSRRRAMSLNVSLASTPTRISSRSCALSAALAMLGPPTVRRFGLPGHHDRSVATAVGTRRFLDLVISRDWTHCPAMLDVSFSIVWTLSRVIDTSHATATSGYSVPPTYGLALRPHSAMRYLSHASCTLSTISRP